MLHIEINNKNTGSFMAKSKHKRRQSEYITEKKINNFEKFSTTYTIENNKLDILLESKIGNLIGKKIHSIEYFSDARSGELDKGILEIKNGDFEPFVFE